MSPPLLIDDASFPLSTFSGSQWSHETGQNSEFNGTLTLCNIHSGDSGDSGDSRRRSDSDSKDSTPPTFSFSFYGTNIIFYGTLTSGLVMNYTLDNAKTRPAVLSPSVVGNSGSEVFKLGGLNTSVLHTLELTPSAGEFVLDYVTYMPTSLTSLAGTKFILDDQDSLLKYSSGWTKSTTRQYPAAVPYLLTTTETSTKGSTMKFTFLGSSISVYGVLEQVPGKLSASFSVDGGSVTEFTPFDGTQTSNSSAWSVSQQFFHQDLAPGTHTLLVSLDQISGSQVFYIDSVVFEATSDTPLSGATKANGGSSGGHKFPLGAIGGIIGGLLILAIVFIIVRRRTRRRAQRPHGMAIDHDPAKGYTPPPEPRLPRGVYEVPYQDQYTMNRPQLSSPPQPQDPFDHSPPHTSHLPLSHSPTSTHESAYDHTQEPLYPPWRPSPSMPVPDTQWEALSATSPTRVPSCHAEGLQSNEKGVTTLKWQPSPTVRNPSPEPGRGEDRQDDGTITSPQVQREIDAGPFEPPAYNPNLYYR